MRRLLLILLSLLRRRRGPSAAHEHLPLLRSDKILETVFGRNRAGGIGGAGRLNRRWIKEPSRDKFRRQWIQFKLFNL